MRAKDTDGINPSARCKPIADRRSLTAFLILESRTADVDHRLLVVVVQTTVDNPGQEHGVIARCDRACEATVEKSERAGEDRRARGATLDLKSFKRRLVGIETLAEMGE